MTLINSQPERFLYITNQIQAGMMANFSPQTKEQWFYSFINHLHGTLHKTTAMNISTMPIPASKNVGFLQRVLFKAKNKPFVLSSAELKKVIDKKTELDKKIIENATSTIIKSLSTAHSFTKIGIDYKNGNLFFWFEIKTDDYASEDFIKNEIGQANKKYNPSGLKVSYVLVEELLNLEIPPDYKVM